MVEELRDLRLSRQIPAKDMVQVVQAIYPKYDKTMQSKCERGEEYGVQIRDEAMKALLARFAPDKLAESKNKRSNDGHRLACRISCRLESDEYAYLLKYVKADGFYTMQDWITSMVRQYIAGHADVDSSEIERRNEI